MLTYGGSSIKKNGLYDKIKNLLKDYEIYELGGIKANPKIESVSKGAEICKKERIDIILAVGGGSTIDCSKAIAAATFYDGNAWDLILDSSKIKKALPLAVVLTISATGSEMDCAAVISNMETKEKLPFFSPLFFPKVAILNPENTFSVSQFQTASGCVDTMSHILENYFDQENAFIPDAINEGLLRTVIKYAPVALEKPQDYEARAQLMWASALALNGLGSTGKNFAWTCHFIEHELSAYYDITHGAGLAVLTPHWMQYILSNKTVDKFCDYAVNVWGITDCKDKFELALKGIEATKNFFIQLKLPAKLSEFNITSENFKIMAEKAVRIGNLQNAYVPLSSEDVINILEACL